MSNDPTVQRFGNPLITLIEQPDSPRIEFMADGVVMITRRWKADDEFDVSLAPKPKELDPLGYNARCVQTTIEHGPGHISTINSTFQGYTTLPPSIYEFSNSRMDRPIQQHPSFFDGTKFPSATKAPISATNPNFLKFRDDCTTVGDPNCKFAGVEAYVVGTGQWRKTSYDTVPDFDNADVGKLNAPETGGFSGLPDQTNADNSWLKIEKTCRNMLKGASILWEITEVWQFNDRHWETAIYGP